MLAILSQLIDNAKRHGDLRTDFRHEDVLLILKANAGLVERTTGQDGTWRRHLGYLLDGLHPRDTPRHP